MKYILKTLNIIALLAVTFYLGKMILHSEKQEVAGEHEEHEKHEEHAGHDDHDDHGEEHAEDFVELTPAKATEAGIETATAGPATLELTRTLYGQFRANEENIAYIAPRFAGIIQRVDKRLGDHVNRGETLVLIESNESLETYEVKSLIDGTVIFRDASRGEAVTEGQRLMTIADLSTLWVDLNAYPQDYHILKIGQTVSIKAVALDKPIEAKIDYISPFGTEGTQTMLARATVPNAETHLRPGLFTEGSVKIGQEKIALAVENAALQTWEDHDVVFVRDAHGFAATAVELGKSDGKFTEILGGLEAGAEYATTHSFILKAELGKNSASHEH